MLQGGGRHWKAGVSVCQRREFLCMRFLALLKDHTPCEAAAIVTEHICLNMNGGSLVQHSIRGFCIEG